MTKNCGKHDKKLYLGPFAKTCVRVVVDNLSTYPLTTQTYAEKVIDYKDMMLA